MPGAETRLRKLLSLTSFQWRYLAGALLLLPWLSLALRVFSFASVRRTLERTSAQRPHARPGQATQTGLTNERIQDVVAMVELASRRGLVKARCLPRSLAAWWFLRRRGVDSELRIGVKPRGEAIQAHAWLEYGGKVLNDAPDVADEFAPFDAFPVRSDTVRAP